MSSISTLFAGVSTFSNDFAQVITRAQGIASLPITLLNSEKNTLTAQQAALTNLSGSFSAFQASLFSLDSAVGSASSALTISDGAVASASAGAGAFKGAYTLKVIDVGSLASATSAVASTITDPATTSISLSTSFTLTANGQTYTDITPAANTLTSLADAIKTATAGAVQTSIVNMGTSSAPSYQLSIQNSKYGALPITLDDGLGGGNLLGTPTIATSVQYEINGQAVPSSDSRTLTLSPDLSVTVLKAGTTNITVGQSTSGMASNIGAFVTAFNASTQALDGHRGSNGGALAGQSIITTLSDALRKTANYGGTGSIKSMTELGLEFDKEGVLTFDSSVFTAKAAKDFTGVAAFLGRTSTGGFLKTATDTMNGLTDSTTGTISTMLTSFAQQVSNTTARISLNQDRVDELTRSLNAQMAAADAMIASMQQQATYMTNLFAAMIANQKSM